MKIERFEVPGLAQFSYIVSANGSAAIIDPIRDIDRYLAYAQQQHLVITHILETHIHADFASGSIALAQATGAELAFSAYDVGETYQYAMPHRAVEDGECIEIGAGIVRIEALHTPGHTPEHLSFLLFDTTRSATIPLSLFSGDFLFVGSVGRPDLLGEEAKRGLAHRLFHSLHDRIAALPDSVVLYPGHGAGSLCGSGMGQSPDSTLGYERAANPLFALAEDAFVAEVLATVPAMPSFYPRMKQLNAQGAAALAPVTGGRALTVAEVEALRREPTVTLLDLRRPEAFGGAHIPGALNISAGAGLSLWAGWLIPPEDRIVLIADEGNQEESRRALIRVGLDRIAGFLAGGMPSWIAAGMDIARTTQLSVCEVNRGTQNALILDVRNKNEWRSGHIANARHIMLGDLPLALNSLPRDRSITVVCGSGYRSSIAASLLARNGFSELNSMNGGMSAWNRMSLPLV